MHVFDCILASSFVHMDKNYGLFHMMVVLILIEWTLKKIISVNVSVVPMSYKNPIYLVRDRAISLDYRIFGDQKQTQFK